MVQYPRGVGFSCSDDHGLSVGAHVREVSIARAARQK